MNPENFHTLFTRDVLTELFPPERADQFFEALFGDSSEGAYDIILQFKDFQPGPKELRFALELHQRPGRCLACNLTHGLPEVFSRHPVINLAGLAERIDQLIEGARVTDWRLGATQSLAGDLHAIPLTMTVQPE